MVEPAGYRGEAMQARLDLAEFLLRRGRGSEARPILAEVRRFYDHPHTKRRGRAVDELLSRCEEVRA
jgi:hypothetical protein